LPASCARYVQPVNLALVCIGIGAKDEAFAWLEKAYEEHAQWVSEIKVDPAFDPVHSDPRFSALVHRLALV
jgi:hypothetical protein